MYRFIIFSGLVLACTCAGAAEDTLASLKKGQPPDVAALLERLIGCTHFAGEEPYDAERRREIATAMKKLKCHRLEQDELAIEKRYSSRPDILKVIKKAKQWDS